MKNVVLFVVLAACAIALVPQATARQQAPNRVRAVKRVPPDTGAALLPIITAHRDETWRWQRVMQRPRTPFSNSARKVENLAYRRWVLGLWKHRATVAKTRAFRPPHRSQWLCHPSLRRVVGRRRRPVLRRAPDGRRVPADVRNRALPGEGHRRPLDGARADVGRRAGLSNTRILAVAQHGAELRLAMTFTEVSLKNERALSRRRADGPADSADRSGGGAGLRQPVAVQRAHP